MLKEINRIFDKKDKMIIGVSIIFSLLTSITEVFGISILFPFMGVLTNPENIYSNKYSKYIYENFFKEDYRKFIIYFGVGIILIFILKNIVTILYNYYTIVVARKLNRKYSNKLLTTYLDFEYINYVKKNRSEFMRIVTQECGLLVGIFQNIISLISEIFIITLLYGIMIYTDWKLTFAMTIFIFINLLIIKYIVLAEVKRIGKQREARSRRLYKLVNSIFSNYKFIKLKADNFEIKNEFNNIQIEIDKIGIKQNIFLPIPRAILEFSGFFMIVAIILYSVSLYGEEGIKNILPVVSLFFLALYRMLPSIVKIVGIFQGFAFFAPVPGRIEEELSYSLENLKDEKVDFSKKIEVKNLEFEYEKNTPILDKVSLSIEKGDRIAFIGESGSGKTTLVDILMGLYRAKAGKIYVDGAEINNRNLKDWRKKIGYIPQEIYLFDGTVGENVSIGYDYDEARVIEVLKQAKIWEFFKNKEGVHTKVGDAGIMLSGGQKQRVGIARALYKEQEILVLDEATSALDDNTEEQIIDELYNLAEDKTLIMIAHRLTTLKKCNKIFQLEKGKIKKEYSNISEVIKAKAKIDKE